MSESVDTLLQSVDTLVAELNFPEAATVFRQIFEADPANPAGLRKLASVMQALGKPEDALTLLADSINPEAPELETVLQMADLLERLERPSDAADLLLGVALAYPEDAALQQRAKALLLSLGRAEELP